MAKLTATKVATIRKAGRYGDGEGLWLQVSPTGTKSWLLRYMLDGVARQMGLGSANTFTLKEARERARTFRQQLADRIDPIEARNAQRADAKTKAASAITFRQAAERYIAAHKAGWKNPKHAAQWPATLENYAYPVIGDLPVGAVDVGHVLKIIEPIWSEKTETAARLRGRIELVLDWARARGYREGENPARWRGHLDKLLPARAKVAKVKHHAALPYPEIPGFMADLREREGISARALEWTILSAVRTSEAIGARWPEIDLAAKTWSIPGDRMKSGRPHRVPLSDRAVQILKALPREKGSDFVFPGARPGKPLSDMALLEMVRGTLSNGYTTHGFRSTFRDWAAEQTAFPNEVAEAALAHIVGDKVEAAYRRGDLFEKRRKLMEAWAKYCASPAKAATADVVKIRARASA